MSSRSPLGRLLPFVFALIAGLLLSLPGEAQVEPRSARAPLASALAGTDAPALDTTHSETELDGIWPAPQQGVAQPPLPLVLPWLVSVALGYALLVAAKARAVRQAAHARGCRVSALFRAPAALRAGASGLLLAGAAGAAVYLATPWPAALLLLLVLGLAAHRPPCHDVPLRGPGQWQPLDSAALEPARAEPLPGRWLDAGRLPGCAALLAAVAALGAAALQLFERSPYQGACLLLGSSALLPVFCTGRANELPGPGLRESQRFLARVLEALAGTPELTLQPLGRVCTGTSDLDELRLALHPAQALPGWIGMELALEVRPVLTGQSAWPVIVMRAAEDSPCQRAFQRQLTWTRGRSAEERAALVRPKLPTVALTVELIRELTAIATRAAEAAAASEPKPRRRTASKPRAAGRPAPVTAS